MMNDYKILIIDDDKLVTWSLTRDFKSEGSEPVVSLDGKSGLSTFRNWQPDIVLLDLKLPDINGLEILKIIKEERPNVMVIMMTAYATVQVAVQAIKLGASDFIKKPFTFDELKVVLDRVLQSHNLSREVQEMRQELKEKYGINNIIGQSPSIQEVFKLIRKIAQSDASTILITGESGTGKDLVAKAIHYESRRNNAPFMAINCGSLPDTLLESELFGHEKGAFTDAKTEKKGLFELANQGTVLLDEIGDASKSLQVKLLRFIEEKTIKRIGGTKDIEVNVRIIAATNRNLEKLVKEDKFRNDLYYRLKVIPIKLAPLRERTEDIPLLVRFFIDQFNREFNKNVGQISDDAMEVLKNYHWSGNVRELRNILERIMILENESTLTREHLPMELLDNRSHSPVFEDFYLPKNGISLDFVERSILEKALNLASGNQSKAAKLLKISRHTLRYKMKKHNILPKN